MAGYAALSEKAELVSKSAQVAQARHSAIDAGDLATTLPGDEDDEVKSLPGVSKGRNRRKGNLKKKMREDELQQPKNETLQSETITVDKAVLAQDPIVKELPGKIAALEEIVRQQGAQLEQLRKPHGVTSLRPPERSADLESRVNYLERIEEEHSKLLVAKSKADAETYADIEKMKATIAELDGKVGYCMELLDDDFSSGCEQGEEEDEKCDKTNDESEDDSEPDSGLQLHPVPAHIRALPWADRMRALGMLSGPGSASSSTQ